MEGNVDESSGDFLTQKEVYQLAGVDNEPWLFIEDGFFTVGKYASCNIDYVAKKDPAYLSWLLDPLTREMLALGQEQVKEIEKALHAVMPPIPIFMMPSTSLALRFTPTPEQQGALDLIDEWFESDDQFFSLTGPAGTGKTTLLKLVVEKYPQATLAAMTGKAALRMQECTYRDATTLHKILYFPPEPGQTVEFTRLREPISDFVIVDESSMMTPSIFEHLKVWGIGKTVRVLLVGDSFQLPPVITGKREREKYGEDYSVFAEVAGAALRTVMRNDSGILNAATYVRETGKLFKKSGNGYEFISTESPVKLAVDRYIAEPDDHLLITWKNSVRMNANRMIRERLKRDGDLPDPGEPVLLKKNGQGHLNGEIVTVGEGGFEVGPTIGPVQTLLMDIGGGERLMVAPSGGDPEKGGEFFDGGFWASNWGSYHTDLERTCLPEPIPVTWGYCLTAHSAQGSEAKQVTVFLGKGDPSNTYFKKQTTLPDGKQVSFASRFLYTSLTRGKHNATMIVGR